MEICFVCIYKNIALVTVFAKPTLYEVCPKSFRTALILAPQHSIDPIGCDDHWPLLLKYQAILVTISLSRTYAPCLCIMYIENHRKEIMRKVFQNETQKSDIIRSRLFFYYYQVLCMRKRSNNQQRILWKKTSVISESRIIFEYTSYI